MQTGDFWVNFDADVTHVFSMAAEEVLCSETLKSQAADLSRCSNMYVGVDEKVM